MGLQDTEEGGKQRSLCSCAIIAPHARYGPCSFHRVSQKTGCTSAACMSMTVWARGDAFKNKSRVAMRWPSLVHYQRGRGLISMITVWKETSTVRLDAHFFRCRPSDSSSGTVVVPVLVSCHSWINGGWMDECDLMQQKGYWWSRMDQLGADTIRTVSFPHIAYALILSFFWILVL